MREVVRTVTLGMVSKYNAFSVAHHNDWRVLISGHYQLKQK